MRNHNTHPIQANSAALSDAEGFISAAIYLHTDPAERAQTLRAIAQARAALDRATPGAVAGARTAGLTWQQVGRALGVTRSAAWRKFSDTSHPGAGADS